MNLLGGDPRLTIPIENTGEKPRGLKRFRETVILSGPINAPASADGHFIGRVGFADFCLATLTGLA